MFPPSYDETEYHQTTRCPYDQKHIMPVSALVRHLSKCTSPNKVNFGRCRYNQYHIIHKNRLEQHEKQCGDKTQQKKYAEDDDWDLGVKDNNKSRLQDFSEERVYKEDWSTEEVGVRNAAPPQSSNYSSSNNSNFNDMWLDEQIKTTKKSEKVKQEHSFSSSNKSKLQDF